MRPDHGLDDAPPGDMIIVPELWLSPTDDLFGRCEATFAWLRGQGREGAG